MFFFKKNKNSEKEIEDIKNELIKRNFNSVLWDIGDVYKKYRKKGFSIEEIVNKIIEDRNSLNKTRTKIGDVRDTKHNTTTSSFDGFRGDNNFRDSFGGFEENKDKKETDGETDNLSDDFKKNKNKKETDNLKNQLKSAGFDLDGVDAMIAELQSRGLDIHEIKRKIFAMKSEEQTRNKEKARKSFVDKAKENKEKNKNSEMSL
ncbi:MAG: hypothetical protein LBH46_02370 [Rickettsiales bacterium]|jgi:hypothetical protein|nr:hypothetical protein [Rickettsiales bacterium]